VTFLHATLCAPSPARIGTIPRASRFNALSFADIHPNPLYLNENPGERGIGKSRICSGRLETEVT